jgi:hypothetical protein
VIINFISQGREKKKEEKTLNSKFWNSKLWNQSKLSSKRNTLLLISGWLTSIGDDEGSRYHQRIEKKELSVNLICSMFYLALLFKISFT